MLKVAVIGLGKMGLSHHAMINAHPRVSLEAVCDSAGYMLEVIRKYTGVRTFTNFGQMFDEVPLDAVIIATPTKLHASMAKAALSRGLHVFCEKPLCLRTDDASELIALASERRLVNQVGYHHRFMGTFREVKRLLDLGTIGDVTHILAEAYGPVVLRPSGSTWRTRPAEGGSCLYDYAAHPLNLLNWYLGDAKGVGGVMLNKVFSREAEDEVVSTIYFSESRTAQLFVNWSDEAYRKMSTKIMIWGKHGSISADRQEMSVYLRGSAVPPPGYSTGWNTRNTAELSAPVWFYLRGEEYSAQLDHFVESIERQRPEENTNSFASAAMTDRLISLIVDDAERGPRSLTDQSPPYPSSKRVRRFPLVGSRVTH